MRFFERLCPEAWVYPCTLEDVRCRLAMLPEDDLEGLWAVGLIPATRKDNDADGRYYLLPKPTIHLFSYPATLRFKLCANTKIGDVERGLAVQLDYGMKIAREGSRYVCVWTADTLRNFVVNHVLLHEVGHHVYHWKRQQQGLVHCPNRTASEQYAEAYAQRYTAITM